ncbi:MAG: acyl carrier protein [Marmoricola sp.]|nr:acyl carrier protein [Marmoricola sp.]
MSTSRPPATTDRDAVLAGLGELLHRITAPVVEPSVPATVPAPLEPEQRWVEDLRVDSLSMVELLEGASRHFGVRIEDEDTARFVRVGDLVDHLVGSGPAHAGPPPRPRFLHRRSRG